MVWWVPEALSFSQSIHLHSANSFPFSPGIFQYGWWERHYSWPYVSARHCWPQFFLEGLSCPGAVLPCSAGYLWGSGDPRSSVKAHCLGLPDSQLPLVSLGAPLSTARIADGCRPGILGKPQLGQWQGGLPVSCLMDHCPCCLMWRILKKIVSCVLSVLHYFVWLLLLQLSRV